MSGRFDVIVIGLGHAGAEAALAAARRGCRVAGVSLSLDRAGLMSCNPAIGGPGKSQLVAEVDALGGAMAAAADEAGIQFRLLNRSKGPALWATRAQVDRARYAQAIQRRLAATPGLHLLEGEVAEIRGDRGGVQGVRLARGVELLAPTVVVTSGTFLAARMHVGEQVEAGGRAGDAAAEGLSGSLRALGLTLARFKTGTPPRLDGRTIDFAACEEQPSEADAGPLSATTARECFPALRQRSCWATHTTAETHAVVRGRLSSSPLFTGAVTARGPRYCPSLEHKVAGFPGKDRHAVYLEPEGLETEVVYPAGLSTSLPAEVQLQLLRTIPGLARVELVRPGYAVEYNYAPATQLTGALEARACPGLFLAGQINGSSGYEEAAGQGLVAGLNAALRVAGRSPWRPDRSGSFLGVLCEDLTQRGFEEPYRVLPARAEARLTLRQDNAWLRLWRSARELGLVPEAGWQRWQRLEERVEALAKGIDPEQARWMRRPETSLDAILAREPGDPEAWRALYLQLRYAPYERQRSVAEQRLAGLSELPIPPDLPFGSVVGLSGEAQAALAHANPRTLGEARQLPGLTPSALALLAAHLRRRASA